jgi:hypothetical protein
MTTQDQTIITAGTYERVSRLNEDETEQAEPVS